VVNALLDELASPLLSSTLLLPGESVPLNTAEEIEARIGNQIEVIVDAGPCGLEPTTVVVCEVNGLTIARYGKGDPAPFEHR
jgi:tRNA A37 threonylcarbamoyladenosine synthetase subunit TsaC/SUA5/YrdC